MPRAGRVLEVGCGHGLLSIYLALSSPDREVTGVDIDEAKIAEARQAGALVPAASGHAAFEVVPAGFTPEPQWDAVVIADVLYLLGVADQERLVAAAARAVGPGGVVVLKEMALSPRWKATWNRLQETLATRVAKVTDHTGAGLHFVDPRTMAGWLEREGLQATVERVDAGYPWPHVLVVGRSPT